VRLGLRGRWVRPARICAPAQLGSLRALMKARCLPKSVGEDACMHSSHRRWCQWP
jgi:hypothetical protein